MQPQYFHPLSSSFCSCFELLPSISHHWHSTSEPAGVHGMQGTRPAQSGTLPLGVHQHADRLKLTANFQLYFYIIPRKKAIVNTKRQFVTRAKRQSATRTPTKKRAHKEKGSEPCTPHTAPNLFRGSRLKELNTPFCDSPPAPEDCCRAFSSRGTKPGYAQVHASCNHVPVIADCYKPSTPLKGTSFPIGPVPDLKTIISPFYCPWRGAS